MNERDFLYWLQGYLELTDSDTLSAEQVAMIKRHIALVFVNKTTPAIVKVPTILSC